MELTVGKKVEATVSLHHSRAEDKIRRSFEKGVPSLVEKGFIVSQSRTGINENNTQVVFYKTCGMWSEV